MDIVTKKYIPGLLRSFTRWACMGLLMAAYCPVASGQDRSGVEILDLMVGSLGFPTGATMSLSVDAESTWQNAPSAEVAPYTGTTVDRWDIKSDQSQFGKELYREAPGGSSRYRTVLVERRQWEFEFDLAAQPDAPVLGKLQVRGQFLRGPRWRVPIVDYFDRAFVRSRRFSDSYISVELQGTMEPIDGHACHVVRGFWNSREFVFWIDPEYDYLPRQYTMHLDHTREENQGAEAFAVRAALPINAPPEMAGLLASPLTTDERLSGVVVKRVSGRSYIAQATLEKNVTFEGGVVHHDRLAITTTDFVLEEAPDAHEFLAFHGLLKDGTPVEERTRRRRQAPDLVKQYLWNQGETVPTQASLASYWPQLWDDIQVLVTDFSMENLRRVDGTFLVAVCATAALLVNGAMAYRAYRNR